MTRYPACYIRRSHVSENDPGDVSLEAQRAAVRRLAVADGHNGDVVEYNDWGVSADILKSAKRTEYTRLLADMEAGRISDCYAFDVDRLYRDPRDLIRLQDAAMKHRVRIVTTGGPLPVGDDDDPSAEGFAFISAVFGRMELRKAKKRSRAAREVRRVRGDVFGHPRFGTRHVRGDGGRIIAEPDPDEPTEPILAAYAEAGSFSGAARLLNERGVRARHAERWSGVTVARVVRQAAPESVPARLPAGRRPHRAFLLAGLLKCPAPGCGNLMTARETITVTRYGRFGPYVGYQCGKARYDPSHPRPYMIAEPVILPWVKLEAARLRLPSEVELESDDRTAERAALEERKVHILDMFEMGRVGVDRAECERRLAIVTDALAELNAAEAAARVVAVSPIRPDEWDTWSTADVSGYLRALWREIKLGPDMRPVEATWRNPALRAP